MQTARSFVDFSARKRSAAPELSSKFRSGVKQISLLRRKD
jgi:hypothetical protein